MIPLTSTIEKLQEPFDSVQERLHDHEFTLGGSWDYEHGFFDRHLDEARKVWLRIPFHVVTGRLEGETGATDAIIRIGTPFVLKHVYNEGLDQEAEAETVGALFDQFQSPIDADAKVEDKWVSQASELLHKVEKSFVH